MLCAIIKSAQSQHTSAALCDLVRVRVRIRVRLINPNPTDNPNPGPVDLAALLVIAVRTYDLKIAQTG